MNYNKTKRIVGLIGAIAVILLGIVDFIGGLVAAIKMISNNYVDFCETETVMLVLLAIFGALMIILGALSCKKPSVKNGALNFGTGKKVALMIFAIIAIIATVVIDGSNAAFFIAVNVGFDSPIFLAFNIVLFITIAALMITSICLKPFKNGEGLTVDGVKYARVKYTEPVDAPAYNPIKRALEILAAVHTFIFGAYMVFDFSSYMAGGRVSNVVGIISVLTFLIGITVMILGIVSVAKPKYIGGEYKKGLGIKVTVIVLVSLVAVFSIISNFIGLDRIVRGDGYYYGFNYDLSYFIFFALVMGYMLIAMNLPTLKRADAQSQSASLTEVKKEVKSEDKTTAVSSPVAEGKAVEKVKETKVGETEEEIIKVPEKTVEVKPAPVKKAPTTKPVAKPIVKPAVKQTPPRVNGRFVKKTEK